MLVNVCFLGKKKKSTHVMYLFWFRKDIILIINPTWVRDKRHLDTSKSYVLQLHKYTKEDAWH